MATTLSYAALDIRLDNKTIYFDVNKGLDEGFESRGVDYIVPDIAGRVARGKQPDRRVIELVGYVWGGDSGTLLTDQEAYRTAVDSILAVFDTSLAPADLVLTGPYLGVPSGTTWTISCRTTNIMSGELIAGKFRRFNIELESVASPAWAVDDGM